MLLASSCPCVETRCSQSSRGTAPQPQRWNAAEYRNASRGLRFVPDKLLLQAAAECPLLFLLMRGLCGKIKHSNTHGAHKHSEFARDILVQAAMPWVLSRRTSAIVTAPPPPLLCFPTTQTRDFPWPLPCPTHQLDLPWAVSKTPQLHSRPRHTEVGQDFWLVCCRI